MEDLSFHKKLFVITSLVFHIMVVIQSLYILITRFYLLSFTIFDWSGSQTTCFIMSIIIAIFCSIVLKTKSFSVLILITNYIYIVAVVISLQDFNFIGGATGNEDLIFLSDYSFVSFPLLLFLFINIIAYPITLLIIGYKKL